jgi:hypothetical protein
LKWEDFVKQGNLFEAERPSIKAVYLNRLMNLMNEGQRVFRDAIRKYNESQQNSGSAALFSSEVVNPDEAFEGYVVAKLPKNVVDRIKAAYVVENAKTEPSQTEENTETSDSLIELIETRVEILTDRLKKAGGDERDLIETRIEILTDRLKKMKA